jgi:2-succinyl-5-enolpyruvyl-6-hydroxy-3-cyclohexene-1-carboxylate synthase
MLARLESMAGVNPSTALATVLVRSLAALGVRHAVLCPGSRSAPLAYALAEGPLDLHVRVDERAAGFLALGLAKASGEPAVVVTTSGTAVANLHPAVLEASHAGVPLLVLSADRPHELRGTGANQTTDQVKLFGAAVRSFAEIPAPERRSGQVAAWRAVAVRAVAAARGTLTGDPGPVHVNVAFREPLVPDDDAGWVEPLDGAVTAVVGAPAGPAAAVLGARPRTVVVAGDGAGTAARELAEGAGWPLLAEPSSGARAGANAVGPYRLLLDHPELGARIERAVVLGRPTLSRPTSALLARDGVEVVVVPPRPAWPDAAGHAARVVAAVSAEPGAGGGPWLAAWRTAGAAASAAVDGVLDAEAAAGRLTGPFVAREVAAAGGTLVAGSSNPVRDLDLAAHPGDGAVLANRGLAGIDGTVSTASGVSLALGGPVRCLVGDLTFLHDAGGLLVGPAERRPDLQVVVVDDGGGGIFGLLEHGERALRGAGEAAVFERVFGTPHGAGLEPLCEAYGVGYTAAPDAEALRKALASPPPGTSVVHVEVARETQRDLAGRLRSAALAALAALI